MCFPALLNYASVAVLIPAGAYALLKADDKYQLFASAPLIFGLQQLLVGVIWICINANYNVLAHNFAVLYLFAIYFWWPVIIPAAVYRFKSESSFNFLLLILFFAGLLLGLATYAPVLAGLKSFSLGLVGKTITLSVYTEFWQQALIAGCYVTVVMTSLLIALTETTSWQRLLLIDVLLIMGVWCAVMFTGYWCYLPLLTVFYILYVYLAKILKAS
tara:strand:+ start:2347 stop:2994 length:648 start_codon:yes stop_codon:yes gene_type:complete